VFPRTAVAIQHEHERAFVANPNVVTFYNARQEYRRSAISSQGDRCDWFGVAPEVVRDVVRAFDPAVDDRPERPFRFTRGFSAPRAFLLQRRLFEHAARGSATEWLGMEEAVIGLLESVVRPLYRGGREAAAERPQVDAAHHAEWILSERWEEELHLVDVARAVGMSVYHLCRTFRRVTGKTLHQYRSDLRVRTCLENVCSGDARLVDIAVEAGFASHSHFTSAYRRTFGETPSVSRARRWVRQPQG
jgi:AraC-like DNA-binding protein